MRQELASLAILALGFVSGLAAHAQSCDTSQASSFVGIDTAHPSAAQPITITYRVPGLDIQSTRLYVSNGTIEITLTGADVSGVQPAPEFPCNTVVVGPLAAGSYDVIVDKWVGGNLRNAAVLSFVVGDTPAQGCVSSDHYLEVDPASPDATEAVTIRMFTHGWYVQSMASAVRGNRIDLTVLTYENIFDGPPSPVCFTKVVGPLAPGTYTVTVKEIPSDSPSEPLPALVEATSFVVGGNSLANCDPGAGSYLAVDPAQPNDLEPVRVIVGKAQATLTSARVEPSGNTFNVTVSGTANGSSTTPNQCLALDLGPLPAGNYGVSLRFVDSAASPAVPSFLGNEAFSVAKGPAAPLTGLWWNAGEPGWGINLVQHGGIVFAAWYIYDSTGKPLWYVVPRCPLYDSISGQSCYGAAYVVHSSAVQFLGGSAGVQVSKVGAVSFDFTDSGAGVITYAVGPDPLRPFENSSPIAREPLRTGAALPIDFSDLWWNPSESGWGVVVTQQSDLMFLALYVFDSVGAPVWYVAPNCQVAPSGQACTGTLYRTEGPPFGAQFDPSKVHANAIGTATVTFSDANNGTLSYTISNGNTTITKPIARQAF